jgi:hypothetical protein
MHTIRRDAMNSSFRRGGFLPGWYELDLALNAVFPIAEELGLRAEGNPVEAAFWVDFDFLVGEGERVWSAAGV